MKNITPALIRVIKLAEIEAGRSKSVPGIEHVLIGMMLEGDNSASIKLRAAGFTVEGLRNGQFPQIVNKSESCKEFNMAVPGLTQLPNGTLKIL